MATSTLATGMKSLEFEISVKDSVNNDMILYSAELIPAPWFIDGLKNTWAISWKIMTYQLHLVMIRGWIILKKEKTIQSKQRKNIQIWFMPQCS